MLIIRILFGPKSRNPEAHKSNYSLGEGLNSFKLIIFTFTKLHISFPNTNNWKCCKTLYLYTYKHTVNHTVLCNYIISIINLSNGDIKYF